MTAAEPVAGLSHDNSEMMQMTSRLHLYPSQQLQLPVTCLPASVQQLTYEDGQFHEADGDDGDDGDYDDHGTQAHGAGSQLLSVNSSHISRSRQNLSGSYASTMV